ncbi:helicase-associated domain-containing protein [Brevibacillus daliensis]|uniref:helicase-associated domain-containing protein n=1 Tax=Brevibacillus daliensis TaxID=2892995 RepID=UPI001E5AF191|nr:helicase-associated domain-containing protein [Brevibacillus daliensis]
MLYQSCSSMLSERIKEQIIQEINRRLLRSSCEITSIEMLLGQPGTFKKLWESLIEPEKKAAILFMTKSRSGFIRKRDFEQLTNKEIISQLGLTKLRRLGLIYTVRKMWSDIGYVMPWEVRQQIYLLLFPDEKDTRLSWNDHALSYHVPAGRGLQRDLFVFLLFIRDHEVIVTRKNKIPRRQIHKLSERMSLSVEHMRGWFSLYRPPEVLAIDDLPVSFLFDLALRLRLVYIQDKRLCLHKSMVDSWLTKQNLECNKQLTQMIRLIYEPKEPWQDAFYMEMERTGGQWLPFMKIMESRKQTGYVIPDIQDPAQKEQMLDWLHAFLGMGMIQLGEDSSQTLWMKVNSTHSMEDECEVKWYADSTGEIMIPPGMPLLRMWEISQLSELHFQGEFAQCILTKKQVQNDIAKGHSSEQILDFLQKNAAFPLPDNVRTQVLSWERQTNQITISPVLRVKTATPQLLAELLGIQLFAPYLQEVLSPSSFLLEVGQEQEFVVLLQQCGYEINEEGIDRRRAFALVNDQDHDSNVDVPGKDEEIETIGEGLFTWENMWEDYKVENTFPDLQDGLPALENLPKMWTEHYQGYHPHTVREILTRAKELRLQIILRLNNEQEWTGIVVESWLVHGYWWVKIATEQGNQTCKQDQIDRIRLLMPNFS